MIRKTEMTDTEINLIMEIIIKKEEQNQWVNSSSKRQTSILAKLKVRSTLQYYIRYRQAADFVETTIYVHVLVLCQLQGEVEAQTIRVGEITDLNNSLQAKLRQLRSEFNEEKSILLREKRELEERLSGAGTELLKASGGADDDNDDDDHVAADDDLKKKVESLEKENTRLIQVAKDESGTYVCALYLRREKCEGVRCSIFLSLLYS